MLDHASGRQAAQEALRLLRTPPSVPSTRQRINGLRAEWRRVVRQLADPAVELDSEAFAAVLSVYVRLKATGISIDAMAEALIMQGALQLAEIEACL